MKPIHVTPQQINLAYLGPSGVSRTYAIYNGDMRQAKRMLEVFLQVPKKC